MRYKNQRNEKLFSLLVSKYYTDKFWSVQFSKYLIITYLWPKPFGTISYWNVLRFIFILLRNLKWRGSGQVFCLILIKLDRKAHKKCKHDKKNTMLVSDIIKFIRLGWKKWNLGAASLSFFSKPCLINFIISDTSMVFSIYSMALLHSGDVIYDITLV